MTEFSLRFLIHPKSVAEAKEKTAGAVGPGSLDEEGNIKPLSIVPGNTVMYSKYAGNGFKGSDGTDYIALRASDVMPVLG
ncbi:hypothetical protein V6N13_106519 [Hibiscus sabdariffa]